MKVTDLIAKILKINNIRQVFGLQGGAVVHIFDSVIKNKIKATIILYMTNILNEKLFMYFKKYLTVINEKPKDRTADKNNR